MIAGCAAEDDEVRLTGAVETEGHPLLGGDIGEIAGVGEIGLPVTADITTAAGEADVIIDFSSHAASPAHAEIAAAAGTPIVIGTTGMDADEMARVKSAAERTACLVAPNTSVGVNLLFSVVGRIANALGPEYDIEIMETHHRFKKDAPSGTAKRFAEVIAAATGIDPEKEFIYGRQGQTGERPRRQLAIHAIRQGDVIGEHTISFGCCGERIELVHKAHSRDTFARGAVRAAKWLAGKPAGLYDMAAVLGLERKEE